MGTKDDLRKLHGLGAWLVLYTDKPNKRKPDKRKAVPAAKGWKEKRPGWEAVASHIDGGGGVGLIPASVGLIVVDVDTDHQWGAAQLADYVRERIGAPICEVGTRSGGVHMYYRASEGAKIGNITWRVDGVGGGEIRHAAGFVRLYDTAAVAAALENIADYAPVEVTGWPFSGENAETAGCSAGSASARRENGCSRPDVGDLLARLNPDMPHDDWVKVGMALHKIGESLDVWERWSRGGLRYEPGKCAAKWPTFDAYKPGGVGMGTLVYMAKESGARPADRRRIEALRALRDTGIEQALTRGRWAVLARIAWWAANERGYSWAGKRRIEKETGLSRNWIRKVLRYLVDAGILIDHGRDPTDRYAAQRYSVDLGAAIGYAAAWQAAEPARERANAEKASRARAGRAAGNRNAKTAQAAAPDELQELKDTMAAQAAVLQDLQAAVDALKAADRERGDSYEDAAERMKRERDRVAFLKAEIARLYPTEHVNGNIDVGALARELNTGSGGVLKAIYEQWRANPDPRLALHNRILSGRN